MVVAVVVVVVVVVLLIAAAARGFHCSRDYSECANFFFRLNMCLRKDVCARVRACMCM